MSIIILEFVRSFINGRITSEVFTEAYIELYRIERDNDFISKYTNNISECLSTIFCLADLYNPNLDREYYELDDKQLIETIKKELKKIE